jgi:hypothetical protein
MIASADAGANALIGGVEFAITCGAAIPSYAHRQCACDANASLL